MVSTDFFSPIKLVVPTDYLSVYQVLTFSSTFIPSGSSPSPPPPLPASPFHHLLSCPSSLPRPSPTLHHPTPSTPSSPHTSPLTYTNPQRLLSLPITSLPPLLPPPSFETGPRCNLLCSPAHNNNNNGSIDYDGGGEWEEVREKCSKFS